MTVVTQNNILTVEQLKDLVPHWAKLLRIEDWDIDIAVMRRADMRQPAASGRVFWSIAKRRASIQIMDPNDLADTEDCVDMEHVLVHELVHVVFAAIDDKLRPDKGTWTINDLEYDVYMEQSIDAMAWAMIHLKRKGLRSA